MLLVPFPILLVGLTVYALYLAFGLTRRRAAERVIVLMADAVRLELPLVSVIESAAADSGFWQRRILRRLTEALYGGHTLDEAMRAASTMFPPLAVSQIAGGLQSGQLQQALDGAVETYDSQDRRRIEMFGPILYLLLLAIVAASMPNWLMVWVWPRLELIGADFGTEPHWTLGFLLSVHTVLSVVMLLLVLGGSLVMVLTLMGRTQSGRGGSLSNLIDVLRWIIPGWHGAELMAGLAAAARQMAMTLHAGATEVEALRQASRLNVNVMVRRRLARVLHLHEAGQVSLAESFRRAGGFPAHFLWAIDTGVAAGNLSLALNNLARWYENRYSQLQKVLWGLIQVSVLLAIGAYVAMHALALFGSYSNILKGTMDLIQ